jgi:hypothetical protein
MPFVKRAALFKSLIANHCNKLRVGFVMQVRPLTSAFLCKGSQSARYGI